MYILLPPAGARVVLRRTARLVVAVAFVVLGALSLSAPAYPDVPTPPGHGTPPVPIPVTLPSPPPVPSLNTHELPTVPNVEGIPVPSVSIGLPGDDRGAGSLLDPQTPGSTEGSSDGTGTAGSDASSASAKDGATSAAGTSAPGAGLATSAGTSKQSSKGGPATTPTVETWPLTRFPWLTLAAPLLVGGLVLRRLWTM